MNRTLSWLALAVLLLGALELYGLHVLRPLENRVLDRHVRAQAAKLAPDPDVVLIDIDDKSFAAMRNEAGRWPWPRSVYADLVAGLAPQKPRAIVFDIVFNDKDSDRPQEDEAFAAAVSEHRNTYFPLIRLPAVKIRLPEIRLLPASASPARRAGVLEVRLAAMIRLRTSSRRRLASLLCVRRR